ncbi:unnamed protein product [Paramecium pentaurelia]|uniref:Uncharacterized protein n=1 Tax=Paramecium pentaurelia TaxID=43138 RepID=A0A8S1S952_9CILI|nr:unnamed protein product [Paramecium pentaurelia]
MTSKKILILNTFLFILMDLATISILLFESVQEEIGQILMISLIVGFGLFVILQQILVYTEWKLNIKYKLNLVSFFGKIFIVWIVGVKLCTNQYLMILFQIYMTSECYRGNSLQYLFIFMMILNLFEFKKFINFGYDQLINSMQIIILIVQHFYQVKKLDDKFQQSYGQVSTGGGQIQQTFAMIQESRRSIQIINSLKLMEDEPWLDQKWLQYEKYLVLSRDLKLKFYSFDVNILSKSQELTEDQNEIVDQLLDQGVKFISRLDNSQNSLFCQKGVTTLRQVLENQLQTQINYEHYYQTFQMQSHTLDIQKYLVNVFGLMGRSQMYYVMHFQLVPKLAIEINTNIFDMCKSLSHELGTNLNCIQSLSEIALQKSSITQDIKDNIIQPIFTNSQQLNLIISNIRDYSSIETDQFQLSLQTFNILDEIKQITDFFQLTCQQKGINLVLPTESFPIFNDRDRFRQVIFQLVSNAVRFTITGTIQILIKQKDLSYEIIVSDTGIGMVSQEENNLRRILEQKVMLRVSENSIGSSLGLFISNLLVKKMNADEDCKIQFHSNKTGSSFYFSIKNMSEFKDNINKLQQVKFHRTIVKFQTINSYYENINDIQIKFGQPTFKSITSGQSNQDDGNITVYSKEIEENKQTLQPLQSLIPQLQDTIQAYSLKSTCCSRVLIVDDEYFNIMALQMLMQQYSAICDKAYNGMEAIEQINEKLINPCSKCQNSCYQLIFLDINMPIMGGIETVKIIKRMMNNRIIKKVYVIANTGFSDLETKEKAYDAGIDFFMTKPLNIMNFKSIASKIFPKG